MINEDKVKELFYGNARIHRADSAGCVYECKAAACRYKQNRFSVGWSDAGAYIHRIYACIYYDHNNSICSQI